MISVDVLNARQIGSAVSAALLCFALVSCVKRPPEPAYLSLEGETMGTTWHAKLRVPDDAVDTFESRVSSEIQAALDKVNNAMSTYSQDSELSQLNRAPAGVPFVISESLEDVLEISLALCAQTNGAFDPTVGPIVNAYGFGPDPGTDEPSSEDLDRLGQQVGCALLELDTKAHTVTKKHAEVYCDLSAVAKGYGVDRVADVLDLIGVQDYMIEVGGEVVGRGNNDRGQSWKIAVESPVEDQHVAQQIVSLGAGQDESGGHGTRWAMATSGDYRNYFMEGDRRVSHTIDPRTKRPITHNLASASVLHSSCAWADGYATALMVMGAADALAFANGDARLSCYLIHREPHGFAVTQSERWPGLTKP